MTPTGRTNRFPLGSTTSPSVGSFQGLLPPLPPRAPPDGDLYPVPGAVTAIFPIVPSEFTFALAAAPRPLPQPSVILTYGGSK